MTHYQKDHSEIHNCLFRDISYVFYEKSSLLKSKVNKVEEFAVKHDCPICYNAVQSDRRVSCFECYRSVCGQCMKAWYEKSQKWQCVVCRHNLTSNKSMI